MIYLSSKNDDFSVCYDVIITQQKYKIFEIFLVISIVDVVRDVIYPIINQCEPRRP